MKKVFIPILSIVAICLVALVAAGLWYTQAIATPHDPDTTQEVAFVIQPGESPRQVAQRLEQEGIIASSFVFDLYVRLNPGFGAGIQAGEFVVSPRLSVQELVELFQTGIITKRLTFIEGWRREQMAGYLAREFDHGFGQEFLRLTEGKEGRLFPDTYHVGADITPDELVSVLVQAFDTKLNQERMQALQAQNLTVEQLLIFASMVEREVITSTDRQIVAGILLKRWQNGWPLEIDATVQYVMADRTCNDLDLGCVWWPRNITAADLAIDSAYNTRRYSGLPPAPIANPGIASIDAMLYPVMTPYWFYLSDKDGTTHFAENLDQHNQNIMRYLW